MAPTLIKSRSSRRRQVLPAVGAAAVSAVFCRNALCPDLGFVAASLQQRQDGALRQLNAGLGLSASRGAAAHASSTTMHAGVEEVLGGLQIAGIVAAVAALAGAAVLVANKPKPQWPERTDKMPPWADPLPFVSDILSGQPFDSVLLKMRERHGDAFRVIIPSLFGETAVLMGLKANQFVFTQQDKNLDQALGGVVGTAVSGKATMGTKERKTTESGKIFDKSSSAFFSNKRALIRATQIFVDSSEDFCDRMETECKPEQNVFELLWRYIINTNADMLYGEGDNAGRIVCTTIDSINKEGLFSPQVRQAGDDLAVVLNKSYYDRVANPDKYEDEDSLFAEFMKLAGTEADEEMLQGLQQFMLTLQLAANGNQLVTIRWLLSHIYADPEILEGCRAEVAAKLADKQCTIRDLKLEDLLDLTLINACLTEAVRLHSDIPSKLTLRSAEVDMEFDGFEIPKGMPIFLYADAVHKDEKYFPKSESFCPARFTDRKEENRKNMDREIVAFGHGRKKCTGEAHARSQISALVASFIMRFEMDLKTNEPGNKMPEDHDGPFVFDTANSLLLVNLRPRETGGDTAKFSDEKVLAAAAMLGVKIDNANAAKASSASGEDSASGSGCPFTAAKEAAGNLIS